MSDEEGQVSAVADKVIITQGKYLASAVKPEQYPEVQRKEVVFIGRSNVGKSSLINSLTRVRNLARVSSQPGKTQTINFYEIGAKIQDVPERQDFYLVDLPGYGYAKRGKKEMERLTHLISHYVCGREELTCLFVLIDSRLTPQKIDLEFINWLGESGIPFAIVFTKADKLNVTKTKASVALYEKTLSETWEELPRMFITSSEKKTGKDDILGYIEDINKSLKEA